MRPCWTEAEKRLLRRLSSPEKIQTYLDSLLYNPTDITRSARGVMQAKVAHCFDGAILASAALENIGMPPLVMDLRANEFDDDHVIAIYKSHGAWGAIGKSNYTGCRGRDPVFRTLRELAMSYFHTYFNFAGVRTLREYSIAFDMRRIRTVDWRTAEGDITIIAERLNSCRHFWLLTKRMERGLSPADRRLYQGEMLGLDMRGRSDIPEEHLSRFYQMKAKRTA